MKDYLEERDLKGALRCLKRLDYLSRLREWYVDNSGVRYWTTIEVFLPMDQSEFSERLRSVVSVMRPYEGLFKEAEVDMRWDGEEFAAETVLPNRIFFESGTNVFRRHKAAGKVFNIACGDSISLLQLVENINEVLETNIQPVFGPMRDGDVMHSCADITRAQEILGFEPQVGFEDGLLATIEYFNDMLGS